VRHVLLGLQAVGQELRHYGLSNATRRPLTYLSGLSERIPQRDLRNALGIESASLAQLNAEAWSSAAGTRWISTPAACTSRNQAGSVK
jgi:hypothetical protein